MNERRSFSTMTGREKRDFILLILLLCASRCLMQFLREISDSR